MSTPMLPKLILATTISSRLSLLKSPTATEIRKEPLPVEYVARGAKVPFPYPSSASTLLSRKLATGPF